MDGGAPYDGVDTSSRFRWMSDGFWALSADRDGGGQGKWALACDDFKGDTSFSLVS